MVILGGQGSITGSVLAAIVLTLMPELLRMSTGWGYDNLHAMHMENAALWVKNIDIEKWRMVLYSLFIILAMLFVPKGIFGRYEIGDLFRWAWRKVRPRQAAERQEGELPPGVATLVAQSEHAGSHAPLLMARHVTMQFGGLKAVEEFNLELLPGELVGLIGPNGAGKTTVFIVLTGVYCPTQGEILLAGGSGMRSIAGSQAACDFARISGATDSHG